MVWYGMYVQTQVYEGVHPLLHPAAAAGQRAAGEEGGQVPPHAHGQRQPDPQARAEREQRQLRVPAAFPGVDWFF